jgi:hypothetical protein
MPLIHCRIGNLSVETTTIERQTRKALRAAELSSRTFSRLSYYGPGSGEIWVSTMRKGWREDMYCGQKPPTAATTR